MPSDFSSVEYWNNRFAKDIDVFEWLQSPDQLLLRSDGVIDHINKPDRRILHIGSGSSALSLSLRDLVDRTENVLNVDYSNQAIELGRKMEQKYLQEKNVGSAAGSHWSSMSWRQADLLDPMDVRKLVYDTCTPYTCNLIFDKGTSDAISCGPDILIDTAMFQTSPPLATKITHKGASSKAYQYSVHPMHVLSLHMAIISTSGAYWLILSYSSDRLSWWDDVSTTQVEHETRGVFDPRLFWEIESIEAIDSAPDSTEDLGKEEVVHRPRIFHYLYVLRRTEKQLEFVDEDQKHT